MSATAGVILFSVILVLSSAAQNSTHRVRPQVTRTSLHVARSLDPSDSELLTVRSKNGEVATLIVKKREGKKNPLPVIEEPVASSSTSKISPLREPKASLVPKPVEIRSDVMYVKDEASSKKRGRNLSTMTVENGVPVIEGVREPDSPEDKFHTWRNAKVINGVLVPYKQSLSSEIPLKSQEKGKPEKQEITLSSYFEANKQKPSMFGEEDAIKTQWKGLAETIPANENKQQEIYKPIPLVFAEPDKTQSKIIEYIMKINQKEVQNRRKSGRSMSYYETPSASRRMDENVDENEEPIWVNVHPKEIWTEEGKISVADRRMDRMEDATDFAYDKEDKFVPIAPVVQGRLLQPQGVSNYPTSSMYSSQPSRVSFEEGVRTPVLQYAHPELGAQPAKVERDVDDMEVTKSKDPHSSMPSLIYFSNDPYADRSPYAHEPGLSEDSLASSSNLDVSNNIGGLPEQESSRRQAVRNIEFTTSASEESSINPDEIDITESPDRLKSGGYFGDSYRDSYGLGNDNYLQSYQHSSYPGKYSMTKEDYYKWKMSGMSYGNNHSPGSYYIKIPDNRPLWEKITDSIKETVQSGVESMKEMTRPVMEPLVEATQRISENLGIPEATAKISSSLGFNQGMGMRTALQEKIGAAASSSPVLLPALGLVGAGAALGLGAVAVGRLLDVNVNLLKRSDNGGNPIESELTMEHKRALEAVNGQLPVTHPNSDIRKTQRSEKSLPAEGNSSEKETQNDFKRLIDESGIEGLEKFHFDLNENVDESKSRRRSLLDATEEEKALQVANEEYLKKLQNSEVNDQEELATKLVTLGKVNVWRNLPCAQKAFCDALTKEKKESVLELENKILSKRNQQKNEDSTFQFAEQVFKAAKSQDCNSFVCHRKIRR